MSRKKFSMDVVDADGQSHAISVEQHPGEEGWNLFVDLVGLCGESFGQVLEAASKAATKKRKNPNAQVDIIDLDIDMELIGRGFGMLAKDMMSARDGTRLFKRLFSYTMRDNKLFSSAVAGSLENEWTINQAMAGNYQEMLSIATFCLMVNFSNLLGGSLPKVADMVTAIRGK